MLIEHDREKLLNSIIYFPSNTKSCGKTKLFKLLYYLDFMHFRETGKSVTNTEGSLSLEEVMERIKMKKAREIAIVEGE